MGNHRDAWYFGAVDPTGGTAVMMEISRVLSLLVKQGVLSKSMIDLQILVIHIAHRCMSINLYKFTILNFPYRLETQKDYCIL